MIKYLVLGLLLALLLFGCTSENFLTGATTGLQDEKLPGEQSKEMNGSPRSGLGITGYVPESNPQ